MGTTEEYNSKVLELARRCLEVAKTAPSDSLRRRWALDGLDLLNRLPLNYGDSKTLAARLREEFKK